MGVADCLGALRTAGRSLFAAILAVLLYSLVPGAASAQMTGPGGATPPECEHPADQEHRDACHLAISMCFFAGMAASAAHADADSNAAIRNCVRKALRARDSDRDNGASLRKRCVDNSNGSNYDEIIQACTALINARNGTAKERNRYHIYRGVARLQKYSYAAAIEDFNNVLRNDPENGDALLGRGEGYGLQGRYEIALADLDRAVNILARRDDDGMLAEALYSRGQIEKYHMGRTAEGEQDIARARAIDPNVE